MLIESGNLTRDIRNKLVAEGCEGDLVSEWFSVVHTDCNEFYAHSGTKKQVLDSILWPLVEGSGWMPYGIYHYGQPMNVEINVDIVLDGSM